MSHTRDDHDTCFRCRAHPPARGGDACIACRRFLAGYTDVDPKDTAPAPSGLSDDQVDYVIALASARGFDVTRDELEQLQAQRAGRTRPAHRPADPDADAPPDGEP
ncbi:MAG: hypothetical protein AAF962_25815 [Actinomycetota bacterium]